ncbi:MAG: AAA family ATPase [Hahellaceae bacterium]|nr:AAA family ATPase [Hahellaceae bacterium]
MTTDAVTAFDGQLWLASYGLQQDPFASRQFEFLGAGQRGENLSSLKHLALFSGKILLVTGAEGAGKSTLLREWLKRQDSSLFLTGLQVAGDSGRDEFVRRIGAEIGLTDPTSRSGAAEIVVPLILDACAKRFDNGVKTVIAIDDAERLSDNDLAWLSAHLVPAGSEAISLVLLGVPALQHRILEALPDEVEQNRVCQIQLKPLSRSEVRLYLESRLRQGGWQGDPELPDSVVGLIAESARGNPGTINEVAARHLVQSARSGSARRRAFPLLPRQQIMMGVGLFGVVLVIVATLYSSPEDAEPLAMPAPIPNMAEGERVTLTLDSFPATSPSEAAPPAMTAPSDEVGAGEVQAPLMPERNANGMDPDFSRGQVDAAAPLSAPAPTPTLVPIESAVAPVVPVKGLESPAKTAPEAAKIVATEKAATPDSSKSPTPALFRDQRWMNQQARKAWTVQMLGTLSRESAMDYVKAWRVKGHTPFYFESVYKGKPWYIVLLGTYRSKDDARKAMEQLPADIRKQGPWLRSVASLQTSS